MTEPLAPAVEPLGVRIAAALGFRDVGRALRDFLTYLPTQIIPAIAGFLVLPILARQLAPTELGVLNIAQTLITLGWIFAAQWLANAVLRELPASRARGDVRGFSRTLLLGLGVAGVLLGLFSGGIALSGLFSGAVASNFWLIVAAAGGLVLQNVAISLLAASLRPRAYMIIDTIARTGGIALGIALVFEGYKVHGYLLGLAIASSVAGVAGLVVAWPRGGTTTRREATRELRIWAEYGTPLAVGAVAIWALLLVDRYLLAAIKSTGDVGVYAVGAALGDKAVVIPTFAFFTAARPLLVTAFERKGRPEVERLMREYSRVVLLIGLPLVALAAATAEHLIPFLARGFYAQFYEPAATVAPIVAFGSLVYAVSRVGETGLVIAKRTRPMLYAALFALAVNVGANLILIPPYGIKGAAIATPIGNFALLVGIQYYARRHATWRFPYLTLVRGATAAGAGYAAAVGAMVAVDGDLAKVAVGVAAAVPAYVVVLTLLGERRASS